MKRVVVGVVGHVDHGKTALVRALTGMDTDRLPEEKRRGISIALGFAHTSAGDLALDLIDMPGHERFVRTMIAGATGIQAVLLVVAANEGVKPQTREHVDIASLLGLRRAVVAITKTDLVPPDQAASVAGAAASLVSRAGFQFPAPVHTAALAGRGIDSLRAAFAALDAPEIPADGVPFLPIDRAFSVAGHGTIVTGTLRGGPLGPGDQLELLPDRRPVRVRALQVHGARVPTALPGQRVAVNLREIQPQQVARGAALAAARLLPPSSWLTVQLCAVETAPPLATTAQLQALFSTTEAPARLRLLDRDTLEPGETGLAQLRFTTPVATLAREHLVLRLPSPALTVAGGPILEAETVRLRRGSPAVLDRLRSLATEAPADILQHELERAGAAGASLRHLSRVTALAPPKVAALLATRPVLVGRKGVAITNDAFAALGTRIVAELRRSALSREALSAAIHGVPAEILDEALAKLIASGAVRQAGGMLDIPRPAADAARAQAEGRVVREIEDALRRGGLTPPDAAKLASGQGVSRLVERLVREGVIVRAHDSGQKRDVLFHREAIQQAQRSLLPLLAQPPGLLVSEIGSALGISRKYSVPLLEHLDATGFTRRLGDRRVLARGVSLS